MIINKGDPELSWIRLMISQQTISIRELHETSPLLWITYCPGDRHLHNSIVRPLCWSLHAMKLRIQQKEEIE